jgi:asparagine synthase (glutamine-hydrolysing)
MCGICGIFHFDGHPADDRDHRDVVQMTEALRHRGPDSQGHYWDGPVVLGAARLAIIDPSSTANQPMVSSDGDLVIVFNGEIYNSLELRDQLEKEGVFFRTQSDTEVLLALYRKKGPACLSDLRGMFALAIWNRTQKTLFLARDRVGEKPLVYYQDQKTFIFCSEITPLVGLTRIRRHPDPVGIHYGIFYLHVPAPYTAFKDIRKFPPASYLLISDHHSKIVKYWRGRFGADNIIKDQQEAITELNQCLDDTIRLMSRSDVPLGATLSGGLDSSAVVSALVKERNHLPTFCISHQQHTADREFEAARLVAARYTTDHYEITISPNSINSLGKLIRAYGEPIATPVALHADLLAAAIKPYVTVVLTGNGGDELFGGYPDHRWLYRWDEQNQITNPMGSNANGQTNLGAAIARDVIPWDDHNLLWKLFPGLVWPTRRLKMMAVFCRNLYSSKMKEITAAHDPRVLCQDLFAECQAGNLFDGFLYQQLLLLSQHSIVYIPDISGMANAVEFRSPFLDIKMIELAMRIPARLKVLPERGESGGKFILRQALQGRLPEATLSLPKAGFGSSVPYPRWFWGEWLETVARYLRSPLLMDSGLFDPLRLEVLFIMGCHGRPVPLELMFNLAMIALWLETFWGDKGDQPEWDYGAG